MAKVIMALTPENGMEFFNIMSFETKSYIGLWNQDKGGFVLLRKSSRLYEPICLEECSSLKELDDMVYMECEEHIVEVYEDSFYTISLGTEREWIL
jgi:hypothetical protein